MMEEFDLNLLRVLVALDSTRNVTRAAMELNMSQSGFSTALGRLRQRVGDPLFVRTRNQMEATPRAMSMVELARAVIADVQTRFLLQPVFDPLTARVEFRLAMADVAEISFLPRLLRHLSMVAPHVKIRSDPWLRGELQQAMETGKVDLAVGYFPDLGTDSFFKQRLYTHTYACIVRPGHPVLQRFTLASYNELGHAVVASPSRTDELLEHFLERRRMVRRVVVRTPHHLSIGPIIAETDLIATVPLATATLFAKAGFVELLALPFAPPRFEVHQYWHRRNQHDPGVKWLKQQMRTLFNDGTDPWRNEELRLYPRTRAKP